MPKKTAVQILGGDDDEQSPNGEAGYFDGSSEQPAAEPVPSIFPVPPRPPDPICPASPAGEIIRLEYEGAGNREIGFALQFHAREVSVMQNSISIALSSEIVFEPKNCVRFRLVRGRDEYRVMYAGGGFDFPKLGVRGISFLREEASDE